MNGETTDVEAAVEGSRKLIPLQQSSDQWSMLSEFATMFASILLHAFERTTRSGYLDEAITRYRDLYKISAAPKLIHFDVGHNPFVILWKRVSICSPAVARRTSRNSCNSALSLQVIVLGKYSLDSRSHASGRSMHEPIGVPQLL